MDDLSDIILRQLKKRKTDSDIEINHFENKSIQVIYFYDVPDYYADKCLADDG